MTKCNIIPEYEKMKKPFEQLSSKLGINIQTSKGRKKFGQAASYFVNSERCGSKMSKGEKARFYILIILKVIIVLFLLFSAIVNVIPIDRETYDEILKIKGNFNNASDVIIGLTLFVMFWPTSPAHIYTQTDLLFAFVSGVLLIINGVTELIAINHLK